MDFISKDMFIHQFPKAVNKTCPCGVTIFTSHRKVIASSRLLQGYYIKVYQGYYVTMTLTNHRPFQNRPTLDTKKRHFCSSESHESRIFGISALKAIVLKNKTKLFSTCNWSIPAGENLPPISFPRYRLASGSSDNIR